MPLALRAQTAQKCLVASSETPGPLYTSTPSSSRVPDRDSSVSLLDLPYEVRALILRYVLKVQPFLSSTQYVLVHGAEVPRPSDASTPSRLAWRSTFYHDPSIIRKRFPESRYADTAILCTCHQLRDEGLASYYQNKYYLTFILEVPRMLPVTVSSCVRSMVPETPAHPPHLPLRYYSVLPRTFWTQIRQELNFPPWSAMQKFRKFHIILSFELRSTALDKYRWQNSGSVHLSGQEILTILFSTPATSENSLDTADSVVGNNDHPKQEIDLTDAKIKDNIYDGMTLDCQVYGKAAMEQEDEEEGGIVLRLDAWSA